MDPAGTTLYGSGLSGMYAIHIATGAVTWTYGIDRDSTNPWGGPSVLALQGGTKLALFQVCVCACACLSTATGSPCAVSPV